MWFFMKEKSFIDRKEYLFDHMTERKALSKRMEKGDATVRGHLDDRDFHQISRSGRVILLINPYIYDIRYPWIRWNQPIGLLRIGTLLKEHGQNPKLIDCLQPDASGIVKKRKIGEVKRDQYTFDLWNYGMLKFQLQNALKQIKKEPKEVWITCMVCYWWKSAHEIAQICRKYFPKTHIVLGGSYPTFFTEHAKEHFGISEVCQGEKISDYIEGGFGADTIVTGRVPQAFDKYPDFTLYKETPKFSAINAINEQESVFRNSSHVISEIEYIMNTFGIRNFAFFDDNLLLDKGKYLESILKSLIEKNIKARFWGIHGIDPREITENIIRKIKEARFQMIALQCIFQKDGSLDFDCYKESARLITQEGYKERSGALSCQYYIGKPGENIEQVVEDILELHHIVGTVVPVPFLPIPGMQQLYEYEKMLNSEIQLEDLNVNLFPFARLNGYSISDYFDIIRMTAMLNKKVRRRTFDFLGTDEVAQALRKSIPQHEKRIAAGEVSQR